MKKFHIISVLLVISICYFLNKALRSNTGTENQPEVKQIQTTQPKEPTPTEVVPLVFTQEQLDDYYQTTKNPYVLHIRKALNGYLDGNNVGMYSPELVIEARKVDEYTAGLSSFDNDYFKSKFIIYSMNDSIAGGKEISIIFQDKPDKIFTVWVYKLAGGEYDFRSIRDNPKFTLEDMEDIQIKYKVILDDKDHSI